MGGSYAIEKLTNEMEAEIMGYIEEIKEIGDGSVRDGVLDGIDQGYFQREIQESSYEYQQRVERGEEVVVGVNKVHHRRGHLPEILQIDETTRDRQLNRLERVKDERDDEEVEATLEALSDAIDSEENVMPYIIDAVKAYVTMGEIMQVFEDHHGAYQEELSPV